MAGESWEGLWRKRKPASSMARSLAARGDLQRMVYDALKESGGLSPSSSVLEVGCGTGAVLGMLKTRSRTGVDISPAAAAITSIHTPAGVSDGRRLPFRDHTFDLVYSTGVMDLYPDDEAKLFLEEQIRVLKPGGKAVVTTAWSGCRLHSVVMDHLSRRGRWRYGPKRTFSTLDHILPPGAALLDEKRRGALFQLRFISYLFEDNPFLRRLYHGFFLVLSVLFRPLNRLPGAVLITFLEKR